MKIKNILSKIAYGMTAVAAIWILCVLVFVDRKDTSWFYNTMYLSNALIVIIIAAVMLVAWLFFRVVFPRRSLVQESVKENQTKDTEPEGKLQTVKIGDSKQKKTKLILTGCTLLLLLLQIVIIRAIFFYMDFDVFYMRSAAADFYANGAFSDEWYTSYFATNTNNVFFLFVNILFLILGNIIGVDGYRIMLWTGVVIVDLAIWLAAMLPLKVREDKQGRIMAYMVFSILTISIGLSPWLLAPYTDIYSMIVPVATLYLYFSLRKKAEDHLTEGVKGLLKSGLLYLIIFAPAIVCMQLKPTNIFIVLCILINEILRRKQSKSPLKKGATLLCALLLSFLCFWGVKSVTYAYLDYTPNEYRAKTALHYMLLGSNTETGGCYNWDDDEYTDSFPDRASKNAADWKLIKERYSSMGLSGFFYHICKKTDLNYNSGTFAWGKEVPTVHEMTESDGSGLTEFLRNFYYVGGDTVYQTEEEIQMGASRNFGQGGKYFGYFTLLEQFVWIFCLLMIAMLAVTMTIGRSKSQGYYLTETENDELGRITLIAFLGMFLFLTIFETNTRYMLSYMPIFALATGGFFGRKN